MDALSNYNTFCFLQPRIIIGFTVKLILMYKKKAFGGKTVKEPIVDYECIFPGLNFLYFRNHLGIFVLNFVDSQFVERE